MADLNARQRGQVHNHSSIFASGPSPDVYKKDHQREVYQTLRGSLREHNRGAPEMVLPSPGDMRCTQNADAGAVLPNSRTPCEPREGEVRTPRMGRTPPRTSGEVLVHDGEARKVVHASRRDAEGPIPKEFWATNVNLAWHDTRHEQCRNKDSGRAQLSAEQNKRQELSSEIFGRSRITEGGMNKLNARQDLLADSATHLKGDSTLHRNQGIIAGEASTHPDSRERFYQNLAGSNKHPLNQNAETARHSPMPEEDPATMGRRRGERNFSDLFGSEMGERQEIRGREEIGIAVGRCDVLDSRGEIAARNKAHWKQEDESASARREQQVASRVFEHARPVRPDVQPEAQRILRDEGTCWEVSGTMQTTSEIARRRRLKDHRADFEEREGASDFSRKQEELASNQGASDFSRKQEELASNQVRRNMGYAQAGPQPCSRPATGGCSPPWATEATAQDRKMATLQSNAEGWF